MARQQRISRMGAAALAGTAAAGFVLPLALATNASAHTPTWSVTCDKVQIDLINYSGNETVKNTVTLTIDGEKVVDKTFGKEFHQTVAVKDHNAAVKAHLVVKTTEAPSEPTWAVDETKTIEPCHTPTPVPTPTPTKTPTQTPTPTPTATPTVTPSATKTPTQTPSPSPSTPGPVLAQTGSSDSTPIIAAAGGAVVLIGGALVLLARKRRSGSEG